ncbi:unnamed protein product, partial [marine sediment metagenome]
VEIKDDVFVSVPEKGQEHIYRFSKRQLQFMFWFLETGNFLEACAKVGATKNTVLRWFQGKPLRLYWEKLKKYYAQSRGLIPQYLDAKLYRGIAGLESHSKNQVEEMKLAYKRFGLLTERRIHEFSDESLSFEPSEPPRQIDGQSGEDKPKEDIQG